MLIMGRSGQGKSALGLELMSLGCRLIADDRVRLSRHENKVIASCPDTITGLIEARGIGLLNADPAPPSALALVVDLDAVEEARLPPHYTITLLGCDLPLINRITSAHFGPSILQFLKAGRSDR